MFERSHFSPVWLLRAERMLTREACLPGENRRVSYSCQDEMQRQRQSGTSMTSGCIAPGQKSPTGLPFLSLPLACSCFSEVNAAVFTEMQHPT